jgi:hypothetical protein
MAVKALEGKLNRPATCFIAELGTNEHMGHQAPLTSNSEIDEPLSSLIAGTAQRSPIARLI